MTIQIRKADGGTPEAGILPPMIERMARSYGLTAETTSDRDVAGYPRG